MQEHVELISGQSEYRPREVTMYGNGNIKLGDFIKDKYNNLI